MIIERIINNNVISSRDESGKEIVVMGSGIGFGKKKGDAAEEARVDKIFYMEDESALAKFKTLLSNLPMEYVQVSNEIISIAREELGTKLNENVYITLTDHISFALERFQQNMLFQNALHSEIKRFYTAEYEIGIRALKLIEEKTGIRLPEDEASSIAIHLVNAEFDLKVRDTWNMTNLIGRMFDLIVSHLPVLTGESLEKDWLLSELKFMAHRILLLKPSKEKGDVGLTAFVEQNCADAVRIAAAVAASVQEEYGLRMTEEEQLYLAVFLKRIQNIYDI